MTSHTDLAAQAAALARMTEDRAAFFLRRFRHEEKLLGPNEQAALAFAIAALESKGDPVAWQEESVEEAAKKLAECMDYPWDHMPEKGRTRMRDHARAILREARTHAAGITAIERAHGIGGGQ